MNLADNTAGVGEGDYIEIANLQPGTGTAGTLNTNGIADADAWCMAHIFILKSGYHAKYDI